MRLLAGSELARLGKGKGGLSEAVTAVVEEGGRIETAAAVADFEMKMLGSGSTRAPGKADHLAGLDFVAHFDKILVLMAVKRFKTVCMADDDTVAVACIGTGACHDTVEGGANLVLGLGFEVYAAMVAFPAVGTDNFGIGQRVGPVVRIHLGQVQFVGVALLKRIIGLVRVEGKSVGRLSLAGQGVHTHELALFLKDKGLFVQSVAVGADEGGGIDARAIDHDGE